MLTVKDTLEELSKDLEKLRNKPGKGKKDQDYLKHGDVALAMNKAFTQTGWDCVTEKVEIIKPAYRCNSAAKEDPAGSYFSAIASAVVTVRARSLFRSDGTFIETERTNVGVGQAVGGKSNTEFDAIQNAITSAETAAFKRACRYFGPSTGLTLQFDPGEREAIEQQIKAVNQLDKIEEQGDAAVEGTVEVSDDMSPPQQPAQALGTNQTPAQSAPTAQPAQALGTNLAATNGTNGVNGAVHEIPEVLKSLQDQTVLMRIASLPSDDSVIPTEDVRALQLCLKASFDGHAALGLWKTAGLAVGPGAVVQRGALQSLAQVLEEAAVGPTGLDGFLAQFAPKAAAKTEPTKIEGVKYDSAALAAGAAGQTPAPAVQTPVATTSTAAADAQPAAAATNGNGNGNGHGEAVQQAWNESSFAVAERRGVYSKRFGSSSPEVVKILSETPDDAEVDRETAAKVHGVGQAIYVKLNQASGAVDLWKKTGYIFGQGQPTGRHLRMFADALPE